MALNQQRRRPIMMLGGVYTTKTIDTKGQIFRRFDIYFFIFSNSVFSFFAFFATCFSHLFCQYSSNIWNWLWNIFSVLFLSHLKCAAHVQMHCQTMPGRSNKSQSPLMNRHRQTWTWLTSKPISNQSKYFWSLWKFFSALFLSYLWRAAHVQVHWRDDGGADKLVAAASHNTCSPLGTLGEDGL